MNILVIGSGGREHSICLSFSQCEKRPTLFCANGNAGIAEVAACIDIRPDDIPGLSRFATGNSIDLAFVGGETSLALGIVDEFTAQGIPVIGPTKMAAELEASKSFAKDFMNRHGVPTAGYVTATSVAEARAVLMGDEFGGPHMPVVVKADGLAAGKGVIVAANHNEAINAVSDLENLVGAAAAEKIVIEECLVGHEVSLIMFADGEHFALMPPTRDHKRIGEGDKGPNTGGMGTIADDDLLSPEETREIVDTIVRPTLKGCIDEGMPFRGILFLGLMMTQAGPKVLEYNVRFGDPETQSILVRLETDMIEVCEAMLSGGLKDLSVKWRPGSSACVVLASEGYPSKPRTGDLIKGLRAASELPNVRVFHAGTSFDNEGRYVTSGGRVLGVTATGSSTEKALAAAYEAVDLISWPGMQYRRDIGK